MTEAEASKPPAPRRQPSGAAHCARQGGQHPGDVDKVLADFQKMRGE